MHYPTITEHNGNLRQHQIDAKHKIFDAWRHYDSVMLQMPTGTGKTYLFVSIINDIVKYYKDNHTELHILVVVHRTELIDQISDSLTKYGISHGIVQGNREQQLWHRVQVASIQSILSSRNETSTIRQKFDYIIVDEAHHSLASTYRQLFETFPKAKKLGVTATPYRMNHETFLPLYQTLITTPQISWFIEHHLLADFDYVSIKPESNIQRMINNTEISKTGDFVNADLDNTFNKMSIRAKLFESFEKFARKRKGIIYAINKTHAYNIASLYSSKGIKAVAIDCDTPKDKRLKIIEEFRKGNIQVLVNVEIFTEGFDCADVSFIQLARPTRSLALYLQQVGRGLRIVEGKEKTIIIDNVGLYNYFGLPDADRDWQFYFKGREIEEVSYEQVNNTPQEKEIKDSFEEDNEEMLIIRGGKENNTTYTPSKNKNIVLPIEEFTLCDYYLIHGNKEEFRVYPLIKKRGKATQDIGKCLLSYNAKEIPMMFTANIDNNIHQIAGNIKIQTIVIFSATLCKSTLQQLLNIDTDEKIGLYELLKAIDKKYQNKNR